METRLKDGEIQVVKYKMGFDNSFSVECEGNWKERAGGLAVFWNKGMQLGIKSYSQNHISGEFKDEEEQKWSFSVVYNYPEEHNKRRTWKLVRDLHREGNDNWMSFGNFNDVLSDNEKIG